MQDNFNIHEWRLNKAINELEEKQLCNECGSGYMEEGQCMECGYMEEATFTSKHDDNPKLKGGQKELPDELQAGIIKKEGYSSLSHVEEIETIVDTLVRNISTNSNIPTESKIGLLRAFKELKGHIEDLGAEIEMGKLSEGDDHEVSMAQNSLKSIISSASQLMNKIGNNERDIPGWIQDHITNAENYIDQANQGFHELNEADYSQTSYTHMRPFKLEIANIMSQLGALNDKIEQNGPLSEEIIDALESLGTLISNINTSRRI